MTESAWCTSSYTNPEANCVEVAIGAVVGIRDTKDRDGGQLALSHEAFSAFRSRLAGTGDNWQLAAELHA